MQNPAVRTAKCQPCSLASPRVPSPRMRTGVDDMAQAINGGKSDGDWPLNEKLILSTSVHRAPPYGRKEDESPTTRHDETTHEICSSRHQPVHQLTFGTLSVEKIIE